MTKIQKLQFLAGSKKRPSGAALIIALCFLVIICAVVLALYSGTRNDLVNSQVFANGQGTILLTDTAVNLVEGQISTATTKPLVSWASQPGMVHAYDTTGVNTAYKLYSSDVLVVSPWGKTTMNAETAAMDAWKTATDTSSFNAMWCDLNAPAVVNRPDPTNPANTISTPVFPIVDPGAIGVVQGFGATTEVPGTSLPASPTDVARRLPMPVKWLYQLKNGQLITPSSLSGSVATFTGAVVPTSSNPIIGRIAFWADDDTCKLNINTASEGTFWDMTRAVLPQEWYFGFNLPILGEFQAIGGHPATTSLDPVLGDLLPRPTFQDTAIDQNTGSITFTGSYTQLQSYYNMNPRITDNAILYNPLVPGTPTSTFTTSHGGTVSTLVLQSNQLVPAVVFKTDRLYATADELLFNPIRGFNPNWTPNPTATTATLTPAMMAQRDFFLTAQSRAPETTLFGTPRISLWPIQQPPTSSTGTLYQSARDQLIAFCATTGTGTSASPYYFQRGQVSNVGGATQPNPAAISVSADWSIPRNQSIFKYATNMMETTAPGFGSSLGTKWGSPVGCERMMTMTMDYIRSSLSQVGSTAPTSATPTPSYWCYRDELSSNIGVRGAVIPLQVTTSSGTYNGMGRSWTVCSAAIQVIPTSRVANAAGPDGYATTGIQAILLLNFYNPMPTPQIVDPSFRIAVTSNSGLGIQAAGTTSTISTGTVLCQNRIGGSYIFMRNYAFPGYYGIQYQAATSSSAGGNARTMNPGGTDPVNNYPFLTGTVTIPGQTGPTPTSTFTITSGSITIQILDNGGPTTTGTLQTETLNFPQWTGLPLPQSVAVSSDPNIGASDGGDPGNELFGSGRSPGTILPGDIVGEVQLDPAGPSKGDYRLLAMERTIPYNWFRPNAYYGGTVTPFTIPDPNSSTRLQDEVKSLQNRFALAFQNTQNGTTFGESNGLDSTLANSSRLGPVACAGIGYPVPVGFDNSSPYTNGNNYFVNPGGLISTLKFLPDYTEPGGMNPTSIKNMQPIIPPLTTSTGSIVTITNASGGGADWSTGMASDGDGAFISAPDPVTWLVKNLNEPTIYSNETDWIDTDNEAVTEPNRVVPSPILLGSLPTPKAGSDLNGDGVVDDLQPWQSLLFCPNPLAGNAHPGFGQGGTGSGPTALPPFPTAPPDHLFCDLFWMPVVEPYAISDPLSTAGKVNLNYEMEPFTHITRRTAMVGVLTPVEIGAISNSVSYDYKLPDAPIQNLPSFPNSPSRFTLNLDTTTPGGTPPTASSAATGSFADFETRFTSGDIFRSASEVCMIDLVPTGQTAAGLSTWWGGYQLTGLNVRESPYNQIYSRITTRSNTYTVHYWVQSLQQVPVAGRSWATWNENQDVKTGEYRGNTVIERYLDPNTPNIPDYTTVSFSGGNYTPIDSYYSWRVLSQKQFAPGSN